MSSDRTIGVGVGILLLRDGKVLLGKRHENPAKASSKLDGAGTWTMPGGKVDNGNGSRRPIVDAIIINDPVDLGGTPHEDLFEQAAWLQPDVWAAYHESEYIFDEAPLDHRLRFVEIRKISKIDYFGDALLEGKAGTTAILKRIQKA